MGSIITNAQIRVPQQATVRSSIGSSQILPTLSIGTPTRTNNFALPLTLPQGSYMQADELKIKTADLEKLQKQKAKLQKELDDIQAQIDFLPTQLNQEKFEKLSKLPPEQQPGTARERSSQIRAADLVLDAGYLKGGPQNPNECIAMCDNDFLREYNTYKALKNKFENGPILKSELINKYSQTENLRPWAEAEQKKEYEVSDQFNALERNLERDLAPKYEAMAAQLKEKQAAIKNTMQTTLQNNIQTIQARIDVLKASQ